MTNKPFLTDKCVVESQFKRYQRWIKANRKYGAYMEAEDLSNGTWSVKMYCPRLIVDIYGNRAIKPKQNFTF